VQGPVLEVDSSGIAFWHIDAGADDSFNMRLRADLPVIVERIVSDANIKGAIITLASVRESVAGADLSTAARIYGRATVVQAYARIAAVSNALRRLESGGKPVACAIRGVATGLALELALACHYRIVADDPAVRLGFPDIQFGVMPGAGGTQRLPRLIGITAALPMLLQGNLLTGPGALELGIADLIVPDEQLVSTAAEWVLANSGASARWDAKGYKVPGGAGALAPHATESFQVGTSRQARITHRNYPAPLAVLSSVFEGTQVPIDTALRIESKYCARVLTDPVARNLIRTLAVNKPAADRLVRRPAKVDSFKVTRLGVLGAGMMGAGIAHVAATRGIDVVLIDTTVEAARKGKDHSAALVKKEVDKGRLTRAVGEEILRRIDPQVEFDRLQDCDLVIEAVYENRAVKRGVTERAAALMPGPSIFASNTSTLPISGLAEAYLRPEQFIGLHFFSPVERMPLVEVILGRRTSDTTLAHALDFVGQLRKTPIVVHDSPGFFTSRVFGTYVDEGMAMLAEGIEPALIENAARMAGYAVGPLAVCDEVTIELQLKVHEQAVTDALPDSFRRLVAIDVVRKMVALKRIGRRGGAGFYDYPAAAKKHLWPGLREAFPPAARQPEAGELTKRFLYVQALESARCIDESIIEHPSDADIGSILGIGYPSWTGGALSFIDTVGIGKFASECRQLAERYGARFEPSEKFLDRATRGQPYYADSV
jgi:3-hydroxyacyl-CoA dehydrogenase / enoyl-CoA hydratase / 3-hydroxybutyryl-CoA epimerase